MKPIITILIVLFNLSIGYSQVIPINHDINMDIPNGAYVKDIDNVLTPYIGTWEGVWEGKKLTLSIEKYTHELISYPNGDYYYRDSLIAKYKMTDIASSLVTANTMDITDPALAKISGHGREHNYEIYLLFVDYDQCNNTGEILLERNPGNPNTLIYYYFYDDWRSEGCPYSAEADIPIPIPTGMLTLTKI